MNQSFEERMREALQEAEENSARNQHYDASVCYARAASYAPQPMLPTVYLLWAKYACQRESLENALKYLERAVSALEGAPQNRDADEIKVLYAQVAQTVAEEQAIAEAARIEAARLHREIVNAAGGYEPHERPFLKSMETRADSGLAEGGWDGLQTKLQTLVKSRTRLEKEKSKRQPAITESYVRGEPYNEQGDRWPMCQSCKKKELSFICQIDTRIGAHEKLHGIGLVQIFVCRTCEKDFPKGKITSGVTVRNYLDPQESKHVKAPSKKPPRNVTVLKVADDDEYLSRPSWHVLKQDCAKISDEIVSLYPPDPIDCYDTILEVADAFHSWEADIWVFVGGWPYNWRFNTKGYELPRASCDRCGNTLRVICDLEQLGRGVNFTNNGCGYVYYCPCDATQLLFYLE